MNLRKDHLHDSIQNHANCSVGSVASRRYPGVLQSNVLRHAGLSLPLLTFFIPPGEYTTQTHILFCCKLFAKAYSLQLLAMDLSARETMKDAAKCDRRCEWQNSANQENAERILLLEVIP